MNFKKFNIELALYIGVGFIGVALLGMGATALLGGESKKDVRQSRAIAEGVDARAGQPELRKQREQRSISPKAAVTIVDTTAEMKQIMRRLVRSSASELDSIWLKSVTGQIQSPADLDVYFQEQIGVGRRFEPKAMADKDRKIFSSNPQGFVQLARDVIQPKAVDGGLDQKRLGKVEKQAKGYLGLALLRAEERHQKVQLADEVFVGSYFKTTLKMYERLQELGGAHNSWWPDIIKTHEAFLWERYLRLGYERSQMKERFAGKFLSGKGDLLRLERYEKEIDFTLLVVGKIYVQLAEKAQYNQKKLILYGDNAFRALAMVYQRTLSGDAMNSLFAIDRIQKKYLYRQAIDTWKRARLSRDASDWEKVDDHYYQTVRLYYQLMNRWREDEKFLHTNEFSKLKSEIAAWKVTRSQVTSEEVNDAG